MPPNRAPDKGLSARRPPARPWQRPCRALWGGVRGKRPRVYYGWAIVAAAFGLSFASGPGQSFSFSVFQPEILRDLGLSATDFSLIYALGSGFSALTVLLLGPALDRYGSRAVTALLALLLVAGTAGMAVANGFLSLLVALAVVRAIGQGCLMTTSQFLTSQWFVSRRGHALSLATPLKKATGIIDTNFNKKKKEKEKKERKKKKKKKN